MRLILFFTLTLSLGAAPLTLSGPALCKQGTTCAMTAAGGTAPYTYSLVTGSVGSVNSSTGVYTAPATVTAKQQFNGCPGFPNNSVFNTRVDALPVHSSNTLWMANVDPGTGVGFATGQRLYGSTVLSTDTSTAMNYTYSPNPAPNQIFVPWPDTVSQAGAAWSAPGLFSVLDNHYLTTYRDTCQQQETYKLYSTGAYASYPSANSAAGALFDLKSHTLPGLGTDAAQLPISPLMIHQDEVLAAAAGNLDAIQHAVRITLDAASFDGYRYIWPAQGSASASCGPRAAIGNGTTTITATTDSNGLNKFPALPAGTAVIIGGTTYTVVSVAAGGATMVVSGTIANGTYTVTQPGSNCLPYGTRIRLKSTYTFPGFLAGCNTACQNVVQAVVRQQQRYGLIVADVGTSWSGDGDFAYTNYDVAQAVTNIGCNVANCLFDGLIGSAINYEIVDESSLQTSQDQSTTDPHWIEAKLNNGYVTPAGAAVVKVTDAASAIAYYSLPLQGVTVGIDHPNEIVMAGAAAFTLRAWVNGASNTAYTCALSPTGGANGSITSGCLYTPPASGAVSTLTETTVTVTATADTSVTRTIKLEILPLATDSKIHISAGKAYPTGTPSYTDLGGIVWWNDMAQERPIALLSDEGTHWTNLTSMHDYSGSTYVATAPSIFNGYIVGDHNDHHVRVHVANGLVTGTMLPVSSASATRFDALSFDCNGLVEQNTIDTYTWQGASQYAVRPLTCTRLVTDGILHMALRNQGYGPFANTSGIINGFDTASCGGVQPCYIPGAENFLAGVVVTTATAPAGNTTISGRGNHSGSVVVR